MSNEILNTLYKSKFEKCSNMFGENIYFNNDKNTMISVSADENSGRMRSLHKAINHQTNEIMNIDPSTIFQCYYQVIAFYHKELKQLLYTIQYTTKELIRDKTVHIYNQLISRENTNIEKGELSVFYNNTNLEYLEKNPSASKTQENLAEEESIKRKIFCQNSDTFKFISDDGEMEADQFREGNLATKLEIFINSKYESNKKVELYRYGKNIESKIQDIIQSCAGKKIKGQGCKPIQTADCCKQDLTGGKTRLFVKAENKIVVKSNASQDSYYLQIYMALLGLPVNLPLAYVPDCKDPRFQKSSTCVAEGFIIKPKKTPADSPGASETDQNMWGYSSKLLAYNDDDKYLTKYKVQFEKYMHLFKKLDVAGDFKLDNVMFNEKEDIMFTDFVNGNTLMNSWQIWEKKAINASNRWYFAGTQEGNFWPRFLYWLLTDDGLDEFNWDHGKTNKNNTDITTVSEKAPHEWVTILQYVCNKMDLKDLERFVSQFFGPRTNGGRYLYNEYRHKNGQHRIYKAGGEFLM